MLGAWGEHRSTQLLASMEDDGDGSDAWDVIKLHTVHAAKLTVSCHKERGTPAPNASVKRARGACGYEHVHGIMCVHAVV